MVDTSLSIMGAGEEKDNLGNSSCLLGMKGFSMHPRRVESHKIAYLTYHSQDYQVPKSRLSGMPIKPKRPQGS